MSNFDIPRLVVGRKAAIAAKAFSLEKNKSTHEFFLTISTPARLKVSLIPFAPGGEISCRNKQGREEKARRHRVSIGSLWLPDLQTDEGPRIRKETQAYGDDNSTRSSARDFEFARKCRSFWRNALDWRQTRGRRRRGAGKFERRVNFTTGGLGLSKGINYYH